MAGLNEPSFVTGLIGAGIGASLSPALHEREAERHGLRLVYQLIDLSALGLSAAEAPALLRSARRLGFTGLNVTHPCKQLLAGHLDQLTDEARAIGAVNTVIFGVDGRATGHNTDWLGFARGLERELPDAPKRVVAVLGAGGAGSAVTYAMLRLGAEHVIVSDTDQARAEALTARMRGLFGEARISGTGPAGLASGLAAADGLIHATPVGMAPDHGMPLAPELLRPGQWVADVVYSPLNTSLLRHARALGCPALAGGGMLVYQAAEAFRLFTGVEPDAERMLRHFEALISPSLRHDRAGAS